MDVNGIATVMEMHTTATVFTFYKYVREDMLIMAVKAGRHSDFPPSKKQYSASCICKSYRLV
jgi:hypothetical protein